MSSGEGGSLGTRLGRAHRAETGVCFSLETFEMFYIGQRVVCIDDKFLGENGVFDPTFAERCPNLPVKGGIYTVRGFVVPYVGYPCVYRKPKRGPNGDEVRQGLGVN